MCFVRRRSVRGAGETSTQNGWQNARLLAQFVSRCRFSTELVVWGSNGSWAECWTKKCTCRNMPPVHVRWQHHDAASRPNRRIWGSNVAGPNAERIIVGKWLAIRMQNERELRNLGIESQTYQRSYHLRQRHTCTCHRWPVDRVTDLFVCFAGLHTLSFAIPSYLKHMRYHTYR